MMNNVLRRVRDLVWWAVPIAVLVVMLGIEVDWSEHVAAAAESTPPPPPAKTRVPTLLPEYAIPGGIDARRETVDRTLFNPTRRPAPAAPQNVAQPQMPRGQFALTGTTVVDGKGTAFLREINGGKSRRVHQGDTVNGMTVAEVKADRVRLTMGGDSEELVLKVAASPRLTPGGPAGHPGAGQPPGAVPTDTQMQTLIERRRAARAAAAQAPQRNAQGGLGSAAPAAPPAPGQPAPPAPGWGDVFRRMQERTGPATQ